MRLKILLVLAGSLALPGCASIAKPKIEVCELIAAEDTVNPRLGCYHFKDFKDDGNIKPGIKPHFYAIPNLKALNKYFTVTSEAGPVAALARLKAYVKKLREEADNGCKPPN